MNNIKNIMIFDSNDPSIYFKFLINNLTEFNVLAIFSNNLSYLVKQ